jgi:hypothetical protein
LLTAGFASLYLATFDSEMGSPDEGQRYNLALAMARSGLAVLRGSGPLSKYPPLQSLVAAPLMKLGLFFDGGSDGAWTHRLGLSVSLVSCVALIPLFYSVTRWLEVTPRCAAWSTALFGITNPIWPYSKRFFSEPLTSALALGALAGALVFVRTGRRLPLACGLLCLALLPLNNMVVPAGLGLALGLLFILERRRSDPVKGLVLPLGLLGATGILGAGLAAGSLWWRFGTLRNAGYGNEIFSFQILEGLHGLLFGWGRSIFVYAPLTVLSLLGVRALWRRSRGAAAAMLATTAVTMLVVSAWWCWWGGICWGPRLVLPVLPIAAIGSGPFFAESGPLRTGAAIALVVAGFYVQVIGFSFKHDFDIYFWMNGSIESERKAWIEWERSSVRRMPRHFLEQPWDLSSSFLTLIQTGPSSIEIGQRPARRVEIVERGDALVYHWSISDIFAVVKDGARTERIVAGNLGARLVTFNGRDGSGALDGDPTTRWSSGSKRLDGMWVLLDFGRVRDDILRLEVEHMPSDRDFPNGLTARIQADGPSWTGVSARAATPCLEWSPLIFVFAGVGAALVLLALWRGGSAAQATGQAGSAIASNDEG